jgi:hydroxymethylbilane synthase
LLQRIHHRDVAERTNVERSVLKLLDGGCQLPLGVYCETDSQGNYHIWAAMADSAAATARRIRLSSSTRFELAEMVVERLQVQA